MVDRLSYFLFQPVLHDWYQLIEHLVGFFCHIELSLERDLALWQMYLLMVRWVIGSIFHGGPIELFLIPASAPQLVSTNLTFSRLFWSYTPLSSLWSEM